MVSSVVQELFDNWYHEMEIHEEQEKNILGIAEQSSEDDGETAHIVTIYCRKTPRVLGSYSSSLKELREKIRDLSNDTDYYNMYLNLVDCYEDQDPNNTHMPIRISLFEDINNFKYQEHEINNIILEWASCYTRSMDFKVSFIMRSVMMNNKSHRIRIKIDIYSKDNFITFIDASENINKLKLQLRRKYPMYDFYVNVYEAFTTIL